MWGVLAVLVCVLLHCLLLWEFLKGPFHTRGIPLHIRGFPSIQGHFPNSYRKGRHCIHYLVSQLEAGKFVLVGEHKVHKGLAQLIEYHMRVRCT